MTRARHPWPPQSPVVLGSSDRQRRLPYPGGRTPMEGQMVPVFVLAISSILLRGVGWLGVKRLSS